MSCALGAWLGKGIVCDSDDAGRDAKLTRIDDGISRGMQSAFGSCGQLDCGCGGALATETLAGEARLAASGTRTGTGLRWAE